MKTNAEHKVLCKYIVNEDGNRKYRQKTLKMTLPCNPENENEILENQLCKELIEVFKKLGRLHYFELVDPTIHGVTYKRELEILKS